MRRIAQIGLFGALSFLLFQYLEIPRGLFAPFLKYDPGEIPALIVTFALGPAAGVTATAIGWGDTEEGGDPSIELLEVGLPIISDSECSNVYGLDFQRFVPVAIDLRHEVRPPPGVYGCEVEFGARRIFGLVNIGAAGTFVAKKGAAAPSGLRRAK